MATRRPATRAAAAMVATARGRGVRAGCMRVLLLGADGATVGPGEGRLSLASAGGPVVRAWQCSHHRWSVGVRSGAGTERFRRHVLLLEQFINGDEGVADRRAARASVRCCGVGVSVGAGRAGRCAGWRRPRRRGPTAWGRRRGCAGPGVRPRAGVPGRCRRAAGAGRRAPGGCPRR
ncbi:Uncharacterised protein [Mycobacteroides abscessus]|nr:Uncharacterised protein [Mycobacteroides abscessus]